MDWAEMLERMYLRWADRQGFRATVTDRVQGWFILLCFSLRQSLCVTLSDPWQWLVKDCSFTDCSRQVYRRSQNCLPWQHLLQVQ